MKIWILGDTHFNDHKMVKFCNRPQNHTQLTLRHWKNMVRPDDVTIHLGDVIFQNASDLTGYLEQIPGKKWLVRGNHDKRNFQWYLDKGFDFVADEIVMDFPEGRMKFVHEPQQDKTSDVRFVFHGHLHNTGYHNWQQDLAPWNVLFSLEDENYRPVLLNQFIERAIATKKKRKKDNESLNIHANVRSSLHISSSVER